MLTLTWATSARSTDPVLLPYFVSTPAQQEELEDKSMGLATQRLQAILTLELRTSHTRNLPEQKVRSGGVGGWYSPMKVPLLDTW